MASFFIPLISLDPKNSRKTSFLASPWLILGLDPFGPLAPTEGNCFPAVPAGESGFPAGAPGWNLEKPIPRRMFFWIFWDVEIKDDAIYHFIVVSQICSIFFDVCSMSFFRYFFDFFYIYTRAGGCVDDGLDDFPNQSKS